MGRIGNVIKWALGGKVEDTAKFRYSDLQGEAKDSKVFNMSIYGLTSSAPEGSLYLVMQVNGDESNRTSFADLPQARFGPLKAGETALWSIHGQYIHMNDQGEIIMYAPKGIKMIAEEYIRRDVSVQNKQVPGNTLDVLTADEYHIETPLYTAIPR